METSVRGDGALNEDRPSRPRRSGIGALLCLTIAAALAGCSAAPDPAPEYARPLPPGGVALRLVEPGTGPDLAEAWRNRDSGLLDSLEESLEWYAAPSSRTKFPYEVARPGGVRSISHAEAQASVAAFRDLLLRSRDAAEFERMVRNRFEVYESIGWDGSGTVLFTGYFAPEFDASTTRTSAFTSPIHRRPPDLVTAPDGTPLGRRLEDGRIVPWASRAELMRSGALDGLELYYLPDGLDAYLIEVNGSAKLRLPDGTIRHVGYAGKTGRPYVGLGQSLVDEGIVPEDRLNLAAIRRLHREDPALIRRLMDRNENCVFFMDYDGEDWPEGSLGVRVTPRASIATDKKVYPPGAVAVVDTRRAGHDPREDFTAFLLDQDTGGAIQAPGRCDIFMGIGPQAEVLAGGQYAEGELYYLFLAPGESPPATP
jgi:membrane-bound lytic murein transglycosylase A